MQGNQEIEAFSIESSHESESPSLDATPLECLKKATTAYQTKTENINVLLNADKDAKTSSFESGENVDNVLSGESLYKTFTFEQSSDEDVEKCIAFWKSVMQKNLEPIKCSIIESTKTKAPGEPERRESLDISEELYKTAKNTEEKIHAYYQNLFTTTLKELQKRRLNEVKLIGKSRCKMCESQIPQSEDVESEETEDIVGLNDWKPKSVVKIARKESEEKLSQIQTKTATCICEPPADTDSVNTVVSDQIRIEPTTNRYKLINIIGEKRSTGAYSRWKKNVTKPCTCEVDKCDCNLNPAIVSWKLPDDTCGCGQLQCQCKTMQQIEEKIAAKTEVEEQGQQCLCGNENCTCDAAPPQPTKSQDTLTVSSSLLNDTTESTTVTLSKDTTIVKLGEVDLQRTGDLYQPGPIKKSSKADVTKCVDTDSSHITLLSNKIVSGNDECLCTKECTDCLKRQIRNSKTTENIQK